MCFFFFVKGYNRKLSIVQVFVILLLTKSSQAAVSPQLDWDSTWFIETLTNTDIISKSSSLYFWDDTRLPEKTRGRRHNLLCVPGHFWIWGPLSPRGATELNFSKCRLTEPEPSVPFSVIFPFPDSAQCPSVTPPNCLPLPFPSLLPLSFVYLPYNWKVTLCKLKVFNRLLW